MTAPLPSQIEETFFSRLEAVEKKESQKNWGIIDKKLLTAGLGLLGAGIALASPGGGIGFALITGSGIVNLAAMVIGTENIRRGLLIHQNGKQNYEKEVLGLLPEKEPSAQRIRAYYDGKYNDPVLTEQLKSIIDKTVADLSLTKRLGNKIGQLRDKYLPVSIENKKNQYK